MRNRISNFLARLSGLLPIIVHLGMRNVFRRKKRSLFVMSTAAIGMLAVLLTMGLINGTFRTMKKGALESGLGQLQIRPEGYATTRRPGLSFADGTAVRHKVRSVPLPDGTHVAARFEREGLLRLGSYTGGVILFGIEPGEERWTSAYDDWLVHGTYFGKNESPFIPCMIGSGAARRMEVDVGDTVVLSTGSQEGDTVSTRAVIVGIFESPIASLNRSVVLVKREDLSRLYDGTPDRVGGFIAVFDSDVHERAGTSALRAAFAETPDSSRGDEENGRGKEKIEVLTFMEILPELQTLLDFAKDYNKILSGLFLTGFALTLLNTIMMSVFERMREIGIQRAIGTGALPIVSSILLECTLLGWIGMAAGALAGTIVVAITAQTGVSFAAFARALDTVGNMGSTIYPVLLFDDYLYSTLIGSLMSLAAGIYPAIRAVRTAPLEALYHR